MASPAGDDVRTTTRVMGQDRRPRRVAFVVDDSDDAQELFREALEDAGYRVVQARDGRHALELLFNQPAPTIVILDLIMPGINGLELLGLICSYVRFVHVPILVVTASCGDVQLPGPFGACLRKPIDGTTLVEAVEALVELKQANP